MTEVYQKVYPPPVPPLNHPACRCWTFTGWPWEANAWAVLGAYPGGGGCHVKQKKDNLLIHDEDTKKFIQPWTEPKLLCPHHSYLLSHQHSYVLLRIVCYLLVSIRTMINNLLWLPGGEEGNRLKKVAHSLVQWFSYLFLCILQRVWWEEVLNLYFNKLLPSNNSKHLYWKKTSIFNFMITTIMWPSSEN